jgi:hypothetical protein
LNTIVAPTFKFNGIKMNPDNEYIVEGFFWLKNSSPEDIVAIAEMSYSLTGMGFSPTMRIEEFDEGTNLYAVAVFTHPTYGPLKISIVAGPDYEIVKSAFDIELENKLIQQKAEFKGNIHKPHGTKQ